MNFKPNFRTFTFALLFLGVQLPAWAQGGQSVAFSLGAASKYSFASAGYQLGLPIGKREAFVVGIGGRSTYARAGDRRYKALDASSENSSLAINANSTSQLNAALYVWATVMPLPRIQAGLSVDMVGYTFGSASNATYTNAEATPTQANPTGPSLIMSNNRGYGLLHTEFFVGYRLFPNLWARAGISHDRLEVATNPTLNGQSRFGSKVNSFFVGITVPLDFTNEDMN